MAQQKIRIRLKGYDHQQVDKSAKDIVDTAQRTGATITGPDTEAPVRVAVSTISLAAVSIAEWSYALRRMRILFCVGGAICVEGAG